MFVNGRDLRDVPHEDAVKILSEAAAQQQITLEVRQRAQQLDLTLYIFSISRQSTGASLC